MGGRGSSSGGGGAGGGGSFSDSWTTPTGNKIEVTIGPKTTSFKDDFGGTHTTTDMSSLEVKSLKFNGVSKDAKFGTLQHTDKILFKIGDKDAGAVIPKSLKKKIDDYYDKRMQKELKANKKQREDAERLRKANGPRGYTW